MTAQTKRKNRSNKRYVLEILLKFKWYCASPGQFTLQIIHNASTLSIIAYLKRVFKHNFQYFNSFTHHRFSLQISIIFCGQIKFSVRSLVYKRLLAFVVLCAFSELNFKILYDDASKLDNRHSRQDGFSSFVMLDWYQSWLDLCLRVNSFLPASSDRKIAWLLKRNSKIVSQYNDTVYQSTSDSQPNKQISTNVLCQPWCPRNLVNTDMLPVQCWWASKHWQPAHNLQYDFNCYLSFNKRMKMT